MRRGIGRLTTEELRLTFVVIVRICVDKNVALQPQIQWMNVVVDLVVALFCGRRSVNIEPGRIMYLGTGG